MTATCSHAIDLEGRQYPCRLPAGHRYQHRAQAEARHDVEVGRIERGAEIVWPNREAPR